MMYVFSKKKKKIKPFYIHIQYYYIVMSQVDHIQLRILPSLLYTFICLFKKKLTQEKKIFFFFYPGKVVFFLSSHKWVLKILPFLSLLQACLNFKHTLINKRKNLFIIHCLQKHQTLLTWPFKKKSSSPQV